MLSRNQGKHLVLEHCHSCLSSCSAGVLHKCAPLRCKTLHRDQVSVEGEHVSQILFCQFICQPSNKESCICRIICTNPKYSTTCDLLAASEILAFCFLLDESWPLCNYLERNFRVHSNAQYTHSALVFNMNLDSENTKHHLTNLKICSTQQCKVPAHTLGGHI